MKIFKKKNKTWINIHSRKGIKMLKKYIKLLGGAKGTSNNPIVIPDSESSSDSEELPPPPILSRQTNYVPQPTFAYEESMEPFYNPRFDSFYPQEREKETTTPLEVSPLKSLQVVDEPVTQPTESQEKQLYFSKEDNQIVAFFTNLNELINDICGSDSWQRNGDEPPGLGCKDNKEKIQKIKDIVLKADEYGINLLHEVAEKSVKDHSFNKVLKALLFLSIGDLDKYVSIAKTFVDDDSTASFFD